MASGEIKGYVPLNIVLISDSLLNLIEIPKSLTFGKIKVFISTLSGLIS